MRETIGSTWVFQLVIAFILIFVSYIAITVNYSKAFRVKNEMLTIIEKYQGLTVDNNSGGVGGIGAVNGYLSGLGYKDMGNCDPEYYGAKSLTNNGNSNFEEAQSGKKYYYCVKKVTGYYTARKTKSYYRVILFVNMDLPVLGNIFDFKATGQTAEIDYTYDTVFQ